MPEHGLSPTRIFPYKDKLIDSVLIHDNKCQGTYFDIFYTVNNLENMKLYLKIKERNIFQ